MRSWAFLILSLVAVCLTSMLAELAFGESPDAGARDSIERAALDPGTSAQSCTCVEGPLATEIEKLRTQIRLLRAEKLVNDRIECAAARRGKKRAR